jgi:hypothetical protein
MCRSALTTLSPEKVSLILTGLKILKVRTFTACFGRRGDPNLRDVDVEFCIVYDTKNNFIVNFHVFAGDSGATWDIQWNQMYDKIV